MKYKVILSIATYKDLDTIKAFIAIDNLNDAKKYVTGIFDRLESLSELPYQGLKIHNSIFDYAKAYYLVCVNHVAIYQINETSKCIYILRVLSHFQDWKNIVNKELVSKQEILIESDRLSIARMNQSMYYDVFRNSQDEDNRKFVPDEVFDTLEDASNVVDFIIQSYESEKGPFIYAVIRKEDHANIGYVQLVKIEDGWEIGYHIAKIYTGHGYATEAVKLFLEYLKKSTDLKEIIGIALASNKASRRVLEKAGFTLTFEGTGIYQGKRRKIIKSVKTLK